MDLPAKTEAQLQRRLHRVEGQVRGVQQMLADGLSLDDVQKLFLKLA